MYGAERIHQLFLDNPKSSPREMIKLLVQAVDEWMVEQEDDITIMIIKKK